MKRSLVLGSLVLFLLFAPPATAAGQSAAQSLLPPPDALGPGWELIGASHTESTTTEFASTASAMYGGPVGSRVFVRLFAAAPGATASEAWDAAYQAFTSLRSLVREDGANGGANLTVPAGCSDARRAEGQDASFPDFSAGLTLCAAHSDLIVLVGVFGEINGLGGDQASDSVLETIVRGAAATPTP